MLLLVWGTVWGVGVCGSIAGREIISVALY